MTIAIAMSSSFIVRQAVNRSPRGEEGNDPIWTPPRTGTLLFMEYIGGRERKRVRKNGLVTRLEGSNEGRERKGR